MPRKKVEKKLEIVGRVDPQMKATGEYVLTTPLRVISPSLVLELYQLLLKAEAERLPDEAKADEYARKRARLAFHDEGVVEIDDNAPVSRADDNLDEGCYVQAWVWVADE